MDWHTKPFRVFQTICKVVFSKKHFSEYKAPSPNITISPCLFRHENMFISKFRKMSLNSLFNYFVAYPKYVS